MSNALTLPFSGSAATAPNKSVFSITNPTASTGILGVSNGVLVPPIQSSVGVQGVSVPVAESGVTVLPVTAIGVQGNSNPTIIPIDPLPPPQVTAIGVQGTSPQIGVQGIAGGTGVEGQGGGNGVHGVTGSSSASGVFGENTGGGIGVSGSAIGDGAQNQPFAAGVYGQAAGDLASGVFGSSANGNGVTGQGIWGVVGVGNFGLSSWATEEGLQVFVNKGAEAGFFNGPVQVLGLLTKAGGGFKIDHPTDPANKYLSHSFVESPDMKNVYDGVVELNSRGEAAVKLPNWFEALNRDFRYQLTAIGGPGPDLHIARGVRKNAFRIAGGKPRMKVSWQITGIRKDTWAEENRLPVEHKKARNERGFYLHPEVHHKPEEKGIRWAHDPEYMSRVKSALARKGGVTAETR